MGHQINIDVLEEYKSKILLAASCGGGENKELNAIITFDPKMEKHKIEFQVVNQREVVFESGSLGMQRAIEEYNKI